MEVKPSELQKLRTSKGLGAIEAGLENLLVWLPVKVLEVRLASTTVQVDFQADATLVEPNDVDDALRKIKGIQHGDTTMLAAVSGKMNAALKANFQMPPVRALQTPQPAQLAQLGQAPATTA